MPLQSSVIRRSMLSLLLGAGLALGTARAAGAQPSPYTVSELAPGVHAVVRHVPRGGVSDANVLIIENDRDVVVVDANIFPASTRQMVEEIRKLTAKPVRYVINTHFHSDHHYGNEVYQRAYPGVEFIAHPMTRELVIREDIPSLERNVRTDYPAEIARIEQALASGMTAEGAPLTDADRARMRTTLGVYRFFLQDVQGLSQVPATLTVADSLVLHRGARRIVVKHLGRGNTPGDLVVHLPEERIVATGDLVVHPIPFAFGSFLGEWPATLRALKGLDAAVVVPGHGEVQRDWSYVDRLIPLLESTWEQVRQSVAAGHDLEATYRAVDLERFRTGFAGSDALMRRSFDAVFMRPGIAAAHRSLTRAGNGGR